MEANGQYARRLASLVYYIRRVRKLAIRCHGWRLSNPSEKVKDHFIDTTIQSVSCSSDFPNLPAKKISISNAIGYRKGLDDSGDTQLVSDSVVRRSQQCERFWKIELRWE